MHQQSQQQSLVYGIALHPYIVGQPFRLRHLRRALQQIVKVAAQPEAAIWLTHPGKIAHHIYQLPDTLVP